MFTTAPALAAWLEETPGVRYAALFAHPGFGKAGLRVRLYELVAPGGTVSHCVTVDGPLTALAATVDRALERWRTGQYDTVTPGGPETDTAIPWEASE